MSEDTKVLYKKELAQNGTYELRKTPWHYHFTYMVNNDTVVSVFFDKLKVLAQGGPYDIEYELKVDRTEGNVGMIYTNNLPNALCEELNKIPREE